MLWKKATLIGLAGFVIGAAIVICLVLLESQPLQGAITHIVIGGIYGAVAMGSSVVYGIEKWSIARATATHFLLVFALYFFSCDLYGLVQPERSCLLDCGGYDGCRIYSDLAAPVPVLQTADSGNERRTD